MFLSQASVPIYHQGEFSQLPRWRTLRAIDTLLAIRGSFFTLTWLTGESRRQFSFQGWLPRPFLTPTLLSQVSWKQNAVEIRVQEVFWEHMLGLSCKAVKEESRIEEGKKLNCSSALVLQLIPRGALAVVWPFRVIPT